jgi:energy-coupling factor transporter ATP-binding protein EcfA2
MPEHQLINLINQVDSTHPRLGRLIAMSIIAVKAQQFLLVVSPSGCGKSASSSVIASTIEDKLSFLTITRCALMKFEERLNGFHGVVIMDDIAGGGSVYERTDTLTAFSMLCHEHYTNKHTMMADYEITDFYGSAILNIQPSLLAQVYSSPEWEGLLQDKTLRYYHLFRPNKPQKSIPDIKIDWGIDINKVELNQEYSGKIYNRILKIAQIEWSDARALQHLTILLRACAALDNRTEVTEDDFTLLDTLMRPMILEKYLFTKSGFEEGRILDKNLCAVIVELASWPRVDINRIVRDYKVSPSTAYNLIHSLNGWVSLMDGAIKPNENLKKILRELGVAR